MIMKAKFLPLLTVVALAAAVSPQVDPEKGRSLGNPSAPVHMEVFSDFQCPGCKIFHEAVLPALMRDYVNTGKLYVFAHEFPLPGHQHSREAANDAMAAVQVGKYQQVSDSLFLNQTTWGNDGKVWDYVAKVLTPAEQAKVKSLAASPAVVAAVQKEFDSAIAQKIAQTPTVVLTRGAKRYPFGAPDQSNYPLLKSLIEEMLK
jgi:protein-disulfide isomerase